MSRALALLPFLLLLTLPSACGDECQQLGDLICECEPSEAEQRACRTQLETQQQNRDAPTQQELDVCKAALDTCTCEALEQERTDQCGFTRDRGAFEDELR